MDATEWQYRPEPGIAVPAVPAERPSSRGSVRRGWQIIQTHRGSPDAMNTAILADLDGGADGVRIDLTGLSRHDHLETALRGVDRSAVAELANANPGAVAACATVLGASPLAIHFGLDPIGALARRGHLAGTLEERIEAAAFIGWWADIEHPEARTFTIDDATWHEAGADEAWCIALQTASAMAYLRAMEAVGLDLDAAFAQIAFRVAMPGRFLLGIAKLRAARRVWARIADLSGTQADAVQTACAALREQTTRDPWVNILRSTAATFAGIVGGATRIDTPPFAEGLDAKRLARNTQLILRDESRLGHVADPAGGSDAVEALTDALATSAWAHLQDIERAGGAIDALRSGWVDKTLAGCRERLEQRVRTRKAPILGVSRFANLDEDTVAPPEEPEFATFAPVQSEPASQFSELIGRNGSFDSLTVALVGRHIETHMPLDSIRLADPYERLRRRRPLPVYLATLGPLAEHTARTGFGVELLAAGGLTAQIADGVEGFAASGCRVAVISTIDARFGTDAVAAARALSEAGAAVWMLGRPREHEAALRAEGVRDFIVAGGDALSTLGDLWTEVLS